MMPRPFGALVIVTLPAVIDATNAADVHDQISAAVATGAALIIADLSATVFCDVTGVGWLRVMGDYTAARDGRLRLVVPPGAVMRRMLELLDVDHLLPVYPSIREACEPLADPGNPMPA